MAAATLVDIRFSGRVILWRGPAPFFFVAVPDAHVGEIRFAAHEASYGWGCVPVCVVIGDTRFRTSLFPKDGGYLVPLKAAVRAAIGVDLGSDIAIRLTIRSQR